MSRTFRSSDRFGHVVQCDIDKKHETILTLRKDRTWYYVTVKPSNIHNRNLRTKYDSLASAARTHQTTVEKLISGEYSAEDEKNDIKAAEKAKQHSVADSGYSSDSHSGDDQKAEDTDEEIDPGQVFQEWLQQPLLKHFPKADQSRSKEQSITDWYTTAIKTFRIRVNKDGEDLIAEERDDLDGEKFIQDSLIPHMKVPKYIQQMKGVEWYQPETITVEEESHDIHLPIHPTVVRLPKNGRSKAKTCYLKLATEGDESAVKREVKLLYELDRLGLYDKGIRAPRLEGFVSVPSNPKSRQQILGFLLSLVPQPCTPMTNLMKNEVPQSKRDKWAKQMEDMISVLHGNKLIWGDAKGDNFLVDKDDNLWMIDFGGSFTVGWIDPEHAGTQKGDLQGVERIVGGVRNPEDAQSEDDEAQGGQSGRKNQSDQGVKSETGSKRKRASNTSPAGNEASSSKRRRS